MSEDVRTTTSTILAPGVPVSASSDPEWVKKDDGSCLSLSAKVAILVGIILILGLLLSLLYSLYIRRWTGRTTAWSDHGIAIEVTRLPAAELADGNPLPNVSENDKDDPHRPELSGSIPPAPEVRPAELSVNRHPGVPELEGTEVPDTRTYHQQGM